MRKIRVIIRFGKTLLRGCPLQAGSYLILGFISQTLIPLALPVLLARLTNAIQIGEESRSTGRGVQTDYALWVFLTFAAIPLAIASRWAQAETDNRMEKQVRERLFDKVIRQVPEFFKEYNPGQLVNILTQTAVEAQQAFRTLTVDPVLQFSSICVATVLIVDQLRGLSVNQGGELWVWVVVVGMVLFGILSVVIVQLKGQKPVDAAQRLVQEQRFALAGLTDSAVKCPEDIQAMDAESFFSRRNSLGLTRLMALKRRQVLTMEWVNSVIGLPTQILLAIFYGFIVHKALHGGAGAHIKLGVIVALAGLAPQLMQPFRAFAFLGIVASSSWPAVEIVTKLLEGQTRIRELPGALEVESLEPTLDVRSVNFGYPGSQEEVFNDLTFTLPPRQITSLVAKMGQGKSTFFRLVLRFYDPNTGQILIGNVPTTSFKLDCLRRQVVMMSQFPAFFHDSVRDNFRVAKSDASDDEIRAVCEKTGLWSILEKSVGVNPLDRPFAAGMGLAGGQKRLFALTRCILRDPRILLLDEPTTNMSNDEKYQLIPMMRKACVGRTVVVVDHDISWLIGFSDHFVVLDGGRITQQGTADQLLAEEGVFRELHSHLLSSDRLVKTRKLL